MRIDRKTEKKTQHLKIQKTLHKNLITISSYIISISRNNQNLSTHTYEKLTRNRISQTSGSCRQNCSY